MKIISLKNTVSLLEIQTKYRASYYGTNAYNIYAKAAITSTSGMSARLGRQIFENGGSVADCAIAVLLCGGVRNPERMGTGGGFVLTYYDHKSKRIEVLLAREQAPSASTRDMFAMRVHKTSGAVVTSLASIFGGLAVAVPGTLKGYWELHKKYGRLPWKTLLEPAIHLCSNGVFVEPFTRYGLEQVENDILHSTTFGRQILIDPFSGTVKTQKQKIYRRTLAKTLEIIAEYGPDALYNGVLTKQFVSDIHNEGGIISATDLSNYRVRWQQPVQLQLPNDLIVHSPPPPSSGPVLLCILNILNKYGDRDRKNVTLTDKWFRLIEVWKYAYGFRTRLGDPKFVANVREIVTEMLSDNTAEKICDQINQVENRTQENVKFYGGDFEMPNDSGTSHFNFVSPEGDAISVTETINTLFGAMFRSSSTGIILNNTMADFSIPGEKSSVFAVPPFVANDIRPGKVPLTSMVPTIVTDKNRNLRLIIGGAGGTRIITAVSMVLYEHLLLGVRVNAAVDMLRLHHQLLPMQLQYEFDFPEDILLDLRYRGHKLVPMKRLSVVSAILKDPNDNLLYAKGDTRRHCSNDGF